MTLTDCIGDFCRRRLALRRLRGVALVGASAERLPPTERQSVGGKDYTAAAAGRGARSFGGSGAFLSPSIWTSTRNQGCFPQRENRPRADATDRVHLRTNSRAGRATSAMRSSVEIIREIDFYEAC
jgi:hypothetical protein